jgi:hypothetical protein
LEIGVAYSDRIFLGTFNYWHDLHVSMVSGILALEQETPPHKNNQAEIAAGSAWGVYGSEAGFVVQRSRHLQLGQ